MYALAALLALAEAAPPPAAAARIDVVSVAAASDLRYALDELVARYEKANPSVDVRVTYGSSGSFFAQLTQGAPFDVYLSADIEYPKKLVDDGICTKGSLFPYAIGRIVVWTRAGSDVDVKKDGLRALADPRVRKVAIANPRHAPYGRAAEAALRHEGIYDAVKGKLVLGENVSQAAQLVESGAADVGVIAMSLAMSPSLARVGSWIEVPANAYPSLRQGGCLVAKSKSPRAPLVRELLLGAKGRAVLAAFGFQAP